MILKDLCPNCGGPISEERLAMGFPCKRCLPGRYLREVNRLGLRNVMTKLGRAKGLVELFLLDDELKEFKEFFNKITGKELWNIQLAWARRMLSGESFALIAPTGVGKTTLLQTYALFKACRGLRVLYVVPTRELMRQVTEALTSIAGKLGITVTNSESFREVADHSNKRIDVLTHAFLFRNKELFSDLRYELVIVDDFDALLKSSSLIDTILRTLGINEKAIKAAKEIVALKSELLFHKYAGNDDKIDEIGRRLTDAEARLASLLSPSSIGQLLIASATGRARGVRVKVLRELLGFEIGSIMDYLRNIVEVIAPYREGILLEVLRKLDGGTLVFVSKELGMAVANRIVEELNKQGIKALTARSRKAIDALRRGDVDVLVGVATYYGILTRGIDEPLRIYNTVFVGIPKFEFDIRTILENPRSFARLLTELMRKGHELGEEGRGLVKALTRLSPGKTKVLQAALKGRIEVDGRLRELKDSITGLWPSVINVLRKLIKANGKFITDNYIVTLKGGRIVVQVPDVMTYIQASGRCSRLYRGRMTLGLSIIFYFDEELLRIFERKLRNYVSSHKPLRLDEVNFEDIRREQRRSRCVGSSSSFDVNKVRSALIIVESPTKARTISKMFGRPGRRYLGDYVAYETVIALGDRVYVATIAPTLGHVLDLHLNEGLHGVKMGVKGLTPVYTTIKRCIDCGYQTTEELRRCPRCGSVRIRDSRKVIHALRKLAMESDVVFLATDPDDEGEKISYDVYLVLRPYASRFMRIEFHEVTRGGFLKALMNPREIDLRRVDAQIIRRVDDRLVGFEISSVLKSRMGKYWLGGGRVQTPVLEWIVSRYREYMRNKGYLVIIKLPNELRIKVFIKNRDLLERVVNELRNSGIEIVLSEPIVKEQPPPPPYTTDTLLFDGVRILKLGAGKVMNIAQNLFELGFITYHRTDSTHVSSTGIEVAKEYLSSTGLIRDAKFRSWGAEGTHECIRPTRPILNLDDLEEVNSAVATLTWYHRKLYELIFRRFIASQMRPSKIKVRRAVAYLRGETVEMEIPVQVIERGFTAMLPVKTYPIYDRSGSVRIKDLDLRVVNASKVTLYTSSDIVRAMKEKGIGRPSTYAKAIENNLRHGYVIQSKRRMYLIPTKLGIEVADLIRKHYPELSSEAATRELERILDLVRSGRLTRDYALVLLLGDVVRIRVGYILMGGGEYGVSVSSG